VVDLAGLCLWLNSMILKVFSNLNDSMILLYDSFIFFISINLWLLLRLLSYAAISNICK